MKFENCAKKKRGKNNCTHYCNPKIIIIRDTTCCSSILSYHLGERIIIAANTGQHNCKVYNINTIKSRNTRNITPGKLTITGWYDRTVSKNKNNFRIQLCYIIGTHLRKRGCQTGNMKREVKIEQQRFQKQGWKKNKIKSKTLWHLAEQCPYGTLNIKQ